MGPLPAAPAFAPAFNFAPAPAVVQQPTVTDVEAIPGKIEVEVGAPVLVHQPHLVHHAPAHPAVHHAVHHPVHHAAPVHHAVHAGAAHPHINLGNGHHAVHHAPAHHAAHPHINLGNGHHAVHHAAAHHAVHHAPVHHGHHAVHHAAPYHPNPAHHGYEHRTINGQAESKSYGFTIVEPTEEARDAKAIDEASAEAENAIAIPEKVEEVVLQEVILEEAPLEEVVQEEVILEEAPSTDQTPAAIEE